MWWRGNSDPGDTVILHGLVGERKAIALAILGFYSSVFFLLGLAQGGAWARCFFALAITYGLAFFSLAAEYFWARWYALGLGTSGVSMAVLGLITSGWNVGLAIWGGMHLLIYAPLLGEAMVQLYEGQDAWRLRYNLSQDGVYRLKRAVKGAAASLPTLIFFSLAPRGAGSVLIAGVLLGGTALGLVGLLRLRFWGVILLGGSALIALILPSVYTFGGLSQDAATLSSLAYLSAGLLLIAVSPFFWPALRYLTEPAPSPPSS